MNGASAVIHKQNKLIRFFNEKGTIDSEHAILIDQFGIRRSFVFNKMVWRGVFIEYEPGKFYIDNSIVPIFKVQRRNMALITLIIILAIIAVLRYFKV